LYHSDRSQSKVNMSDTTPTIATAAGGAAAAANKGAEPVKAKATADMSSLFDALADANEEGKKIAEAGALSTKDMMEALRNTDKRDAEKMEFGPLFAKPFAATTPTNSLLVPTGIVKKVVEAESKKQEERKQNAVGSAASFQYALAQHASETTAGGIFDASEYTRDYSGKSKGNRRKHSSKAKGQAYNEKRALKAVRGRGTRKDRMKAY
jgi:hypothetical protein